MTPQFPLLLFAVITPAFWVLLNAQSPRLVNPIAPIRFQNVAPVAGIDFVLENSATLEKHVIETMVGGMASCASWRRLYFNNDGKIDVVVSAIGEPAELSEHQRRRKFLADSEIAGHPEQSGRRGRTRSDRNTN